MAMLRSVSSSFICRPLRSRCSCRASFTATSQWLDGTQPGPSSGNADLAERQSAMRAEITRKQAAYQAKYAERLQQKAKEAGVDSVEQLRTKRILEASAARANQSAPSNNAPTSAKGKAPAYKGEERLPIKPLASILDLQKVAADKLTAEQVGQLWTTYHSTNTVYLSAVIPLATYRKMLATAALYPEFVVPLARGTDGEAVEMWLLQWSRPTLSASTVLFTPMAAFHARGTYAAPALILTHYGDLADSHEIVLMRGERTEEAKHLLTPEEAKVLVWRLARFFNTTADETSADGKRYRGLLEDFHRRRQPHEPEFNITELIKISHEV